MARKYADATTRFHESYEVDKKTKCWLWACSLDTNGYGRLRNNDGRLVSARRFALIEIAGKFIPPGYSATQICTGGRQCVNPDHLTSVSGSVIAAKRPGYGGSRSAVDPAARRQS
ncbi:hypothetical protein EV645_5723 [Kribbella rubisoli]|uniref:HNH endonuclease n=1 Tax=Kribbella rubisoli TaxID=3075929 RepID=A0A4Q7WRH1_9ACTN|nr:hypothetical protein [Kribbella rubisoli]RZU12453.1 hypothetical protein EV645_5723 [Kribbella rubisoli]